MKDFDFDEWAALYKRDPRAFEARRQMLLAIEMAKGGDKAEPVRAAMRHIEQDLAGQPEAERARRSMVWMMASLQQLNGRMNELSKQLNSLNQALADAGSSTQAVPSPKSAGLDGSHPKAA